MPLRILNLFTSVWSVLLEKLHSLVAGLGCECLWGLIAHHRGPLATFFPSSSPVFLLWAPPNVEQPYILLCSGTFQRGQRQGLKGKAVCWRPV